MDSKLKKNEVVENKDRHFGSNLVYFPCMIETEHGTEEPALFTEDQIKIAINRAKINPEDIEEAKKGFLEEIFGFLF